MQKEQEKEILEDIKKNGFKVGPPPSNGAEYGPTPIQKTAFEIPHKHELDIILMYGGGRAGKSLCSCAAGMSYMLKYPKIDIMVGCEQYRHLERTILNDYRKLLSVNQDWDHPLILKRGGGRPTSHNKKLRLINGSTAYFMHFSDFTILRGANLGFAHIEEASLLKDKAVLGEVIRRMSNTSVKQKQIFITSNPEETHGWLYETFALEQFQPGYEGPSLPIGKPCNCQFCQKCINLNTPREILYIDGKCPECKAVKTHECPGNQQYWRVVFCDPRDNPHLSDTYRQTQKLSTSDAEFQLYTEGKVMELRTGRVYSNFSRRINCLPEDKPINFEQPMFWNHDFNISYQSSVICQEIETGGEETITEVLDEIIKPQASPVDVAKEWLKRYHLFNQTIYMVFDPAAFNNTIGPDDGMIRVKLILDVLEHPENHGFPHTKPKKVVLLTKKIEKKTKVLVSARVDCTNAMLNDGMGKARLFINPKCVWTIRSLEGLNWKENEGKAVIDVSVDKAAQKAPDKTIIRVLSHPTDALGYYIYKRFPQYEQKYSQMYAYIPGNPLITTSKDGKTIQELPEPVLLTKICPRCSAEFFEKDEICPQDKNILIPKVDLTANLDSPQDSSKISLLKFLQLEGAFDRIEENPFNSYW